MQEVAAATAAVSAAAKGSAAVDSGDKALAKRGRQIEKDLKRTFAGEETSVNTEQVLAAESLEAEWGGTMVAGMLSLCCVVVSPSLSRRDGRRCAVCWAPTRHTTRRRGIVSR
jgi:hypothetical protein